MTSTDQLEIGNVLSAESRFLLKATSAAMSFTGESNDFVAVSVNNDLSDTTSILYFSQSGM